MSGEREHLLGNRILHYNSLTGASDIEEAASASSFSPQIDVDTSSLSCPKVSRRPFNLQFDPEREREDDDGSLLSFENDDIGGHERETTMDISMQLARLDPSSVLQAVVFLEDAYWYRSIYHRVTHRELTVYRRYQSLSLYLFRMSVIFILHMLAFFEYPSSLTLTSDLRYEGKRIQAACWLTKSIEISCLLFLLLDNLLRVYWMGTHYFVRHKWDFLAMILLIMSLIDWSVSLGLGCSDFVRLRRFVRPFFIVQHSSIMKKIVNCLFQSLPEIASILLMLAIHLLIFTLLGMLIFADELATYKNGTDHPILPSNVTAMPINDITNGKDMYFKSFLDSLIQLLVLLTTANNPDVTMEAYSKNRFSSLFFILYLLIGLYCFMNILLAVIYNQFRGYFQTSLQSSLLRRRLGVRASFEVLRRKSPRKDMQNIDILGFVGIGVGGYVIEMVIQKSFLPKHIKNDLYQAIDGRVSKLFSAREYQDLFYCLDNEVRQKQKPAISWCENLNWRKLQICIAHRYFVYFGIFIVIVNLLVLTVQMSFKYDSNFRDDYVVLLIVNFSFMFYYVLEQCLKLWAFGWRHYLYSSGNIFDAFITLALVITETCCISIYGFPHSFRHFGLNKSNLMWNIIRIINILIVVRMWKIIPHFKAMSLVASVILDLVRNMKAFAGILVVLFYIFALLGIELFHGAIQLPKNYTHMQFECGTYEQLQYWANNFDDFFAAIVVLWDVMVVNNWHVFLHVFREKTSPWSYLYFVAWWLMSVIVVLNLFTALIMENFIMKWDKRRDYQRSSSVSEDVTVSQPLSNVHSMFKDLLHEPADSELIQLISDHQFMSLDH